MSKQIVNLSAAESGRVARRIFKKDLELFFSPQIAKHPPREGGDPIRANLRFTSIFTFFNRVFDKKHKCAVY